jgi:hypothetical protein
MKCCNDVMIVKNIYYVGQGNVAMTGQTRVWVLGKSDGHGREDFFHQILGGMLNIVLLYIHVLKV